MRILSSRQMHELDHLTITKEKITSLALMERAANKLALAIVHSVKIQSPHYVIFCGCGNNGGDGLAIARIMHSWGEDVDCYAIRGFSKYSPDYEANYQSAVSTGVLHQICSADDIPDFSNNDIVIDAIFGSGLNKPVAGLPADVIWAINTRAKGFAESVVAIDVPSGLSDQNIPGPDEAVIKADQTLTIEQPFLSMMFPENSEIVGNLKTVNIGLLHSELKNVDSPYYLTNQDTIRAFVRPRKKFSHKGTFGHTLIIAGAYGKAGASVLCSRACHRGGTGLLTTHVPQRLVDVLQCATPETMLSIDDNDRIFSQCPDPGRYTCVGIGPGLGTDPVSAKAMYELLTKVKNPMVIDADALNILSQNPLWIGMLPELSILTPHPKEFERLFGHTENSIQRLQVLQANASRYNIIIVLKGANTAIAFPDGTIRFNTTGNPGMATAGSGDVLTGLLAALLSQGYSPDKAALMGVYVHGLAGDIAAEKLGHQGVIASDIVDSIPLAIKKLLND